MASSQMRLSAGHVLEGAAYSLQSSGCGLTCRRASLAFRRRASSAFGWGKGTSDWFGEAVGTATCFSPRRKEGQHVKGAVKVEARKSGFSELLNLRKGSSRKRPGGESRRPPLVRGTVSPKLPVPEHIPRPSYAATGVPPTWSDDYQVHGEEGIEKMRAAGRLAAQVREAAGKLVKPGVTTNEIDIAVHSMIIDAGAYPSPLNYGAFPKSVCTSVNECICHGIPDSRPLQDGDIINIDVTVFLNGYHGDTSSTFFCGTVDPEAKRLVETTREALEKAIAICGPGVPIRNIGNTIQEVADKAKFGVVKKFVGHGVGSIFHSGPAIVHCRNNYPGALIPGMTFTIEPMLVQGNIREVMWDDGWTAVTADGSLAAQFEHTLLVMDSGVEILTL